LPPNKTARLLSVPCCDLIDKMPHYQKMRFNADLKIALHLAIFRQLAHHP
jgi:hypothetical protein